MNQNDWSFQEEDAFNVALSQRTDELYRVANAAPDEDGCIEALVLPLRDIVVFPHMVTPVFVSREPSLLAIQEAHDHDRTIIGLTQRELGRGKPRTPGFPAHWRGNGSGAAAFNAGRLVIGAGTGTEKGGSGGVYAADPGAQGARQGDR